MDLIKIIYETIRDRLKAEVPAIVFIDEDNDQLDYEEPPVSFPCALVDILNLNYDSTEDYFFSGTVLVKVTFAFKSYLPTDSLTPSAEAFAWSPTLASGISAINGHEPSNSTGFIKQGYTRVKRPGLKVYEALFNINFAGHNV